MGLGTGRGFTTVPKSGSGTRAATGRFKKGGGGGGGVTGVREI